MIDPDDLARLADDAVAARAAGMNAGELVEAHELAVLWRLAARTPLRAELLRRLRQWDALAMGPVDPPAAPPPPA